jgi:sulfoxide reductase heme-binding subunit YedZ
MKPLSRTVRDRLIEGAVTFACVAPMAIILWTNRDSGYVPGNRITELTGIVAIWLLVLVLAIRPIAQRLRQRWMMRCRRIVGLSVFAYSLVHVAVYFVVDKPLADIRLLEAPYLLMGVFALGLLVPMVATSSNAMMKRLGGEQWKRIHRLIYVAAPLAAAHYLLPWFMDRGALAVAVLTGLLLAYRALEFARKHRQRAGGLNGVVNYARRGMASGPGPLSSGPGSRELTF